MGPSYKVVRMWEEAAIVQVSLEYWTDAKVFTITYFGEHLMINKPKETVGQPLTRLFTRLDFTPERLELHL